MNCNQAGRHCSTTTHIVLTVFRSGNSCATTMPLLLQQQNNKKTIIIMWNVCLVAHRNIIVSSYVCDIYECHGGNKTRLRIQQLIRRWKLIREVVTSVCWCLQSTDQSSRGRRYNKMFDMTSASIVSTHCRQLLKYERKNEFVVDYISCFLRVNGLHCREKHSFR